MTPFFVMLFSLSIIILVLFIHTYQILFNMIFCHSEIQEVLTSKVHLDPGVSEEGSWACQLENSFAAIRGTSTNLFWLMEFISG